MEIDVYNVRMTNELRNILNKQDVFELKGVTPLDTYLHDDIPTDQDTFSITEYGVRRFLAWLDEIKELEQHVVSASDIIAVEEMFDAASVRTVETEELDVETQRTLESIIEKDLEDMQSRQSNRSSMGETYRDNVNSVVSKFYRIARRLPRD